MKRSASGLTLIELLVAIAIFAILGVLSYKALESAAQSRERLSQEFGDWQKISRALNRLEVEFIQMGARAQGQTSGDVALQYNSSAQGYSRLAFWRLDANQGAKREGIEYSGESIFLLRWRSGDILQEPARDALLDGVKSVRWQFVPHGETAWTDTWPPASNRATEFPDGIRVEIELVGKGKISRVFALR